MTFEDSEDFQKTIKNNSIRFSSFAAHKKKNNRKKRRILRMFVGSSVRCETNEIYGIFDCNRKKSTANQQVQFVISFLSSNSNTVDCLIFTNCAIAIVFVVDFLIKLHRRIVAIRWELFEKFHLVNCVLRLSKALWSASLSRVHRTICARFRFTLSHTNMATATTTRTTNDTHLIWCHCILVCRRHFVPQICIMKLTNKL